MNEKVEREKEPPEKRNFKTQIITPRNVLFSLKKNIFSGKINILRPSLQLLKTKLKILCLLGTVYYPDKIIFISFEKGLFSNSIY